MGKRVIRAIAFDWGGVLAESTDDALYDKVGKPHNLSRKEFLDYVHKLELGRESKSSNPKFWSKITRHFNLNMSAEQLMYIYNKVPVSPVYALLKQLEKHYDLYLLSDQIAEKAKFIRDNYDLSIFKGIFFSCDLGVTKLDGPGFFLRVIERTGINPSNVLFIDDKEENVKNAEKAGMHAILFKNMFQLKKNLKGLWVLGLEVQNS